MQETLAVISLKQIGRNARLVQKRADAPLMAVVKDDGYGHGAERVAHALEGIASGFAVATVREGVALRVAGISAPVLVLTPCLTEGEALAAHAHALMPTVSSFPALALLLRAAEKFGFAPKAHLAVNTGMNRYGFQPERIGEAVRRAEKGGLLVEGVFSHFYAPEDAAARERQYELFCRASSEVKARFPDAVRHLSATGGILAGRKYNFDCVRSGIALYGYLPSGFGGELPVRPAMKLYASVAGSGPFTGGGVGYQRAEREYGPLHVLRLGYGDGFFRSEGPGVGVLCMDACIAEGEAPFGARRLVLGSVTKYARAHNTTEYEVLVRIGARAEKVYV